jgi:hypothetical protein
MTFASEPPCERFPTSDAQSGDACGVSPGTGTIAALDPFLYRDMRWCTRCGGEQVFVPMFECEFGRVGVCMGCGEEKLQRFTRAIGEAA